MAVVVSSQMTGSGTFTMPGTLADDTRLPNDTAFVHRDRVWKNDEALDVCCPDSCVRLHGRVVCARTITTVNRLVIEHIVWCIALRGQFSMATKVQFAVWKKPRA